MFHRLKYYDNSVINHWWKKLVNFLRCIMHNITPNCKNSFEDEASNLPSLHPELIKFIERFKFHQRGIVADNTQRGNGFPDNHRDNE